MLTNLLTSIFALPLALESLLSQHSSILALDLKQFKRDYKLHDYPVTRY